MTPFTLPCPECRADMLEVSHYPLDSDTPAPEAHPVQAETYFWCLECGHEEVYTSPRIASDMDDPAEITRWMYGDTPTERITPVDGGAS